MLRDYAKLSTSPACAYVAVGILVRGGSNGIFDPAVQAWGRAGWSLSLVVNTTVVCAIAGRLWWADMRIRPFYRGGIYTPTILTIVESGAIFLAATFVMFILDITNNPAASVGIPATTQLAVRLNLWYTCLCLLRG
jgi:hypothetical protein